MFKEQIIPTLYKLLQQMEKGKTLYNSFYEAAKPNTKTSQGHYKNKSFQAS